MDRASEQNIRLEWQRVARNLDDLYRMKLGNGFMEAAYNQRSEALPLEPGATAPRYIHHASKTTYAVASVITDTADFPYEHLIQGDDVVFYDQNGVLRRVIFPNNEHVPLAEQGNGPVGEAREDPALREVGIGGLVGMDPQRVGQDAPVQDPPRAFPEPSTPPSRSADEIFNLIGLAGLSPTPSLDGDGTLFESIQEAVRHFNDESDDDTEHWKLGDTAADLKRKTNRLLATLRAYSPTRSAPRGQSGSTCANNRPLAPHPEFAPGGVLAGEPSYATASNSGLAASQASTAAPTGAGPSNIIDLSMDSDAGPASEPHSAKQGASLHGPDQNGKRKATDDAPKAKYHPASKPYLSPQTRRNAHILAARPKAVKKRKSKTTQTGA